jgi:hypothetical protein
MKLSKYFALVLAMLVAFASTTSGAFAANKQFVGIVNNGPIILPAFCGDDETKSGYVSAPGMPLLSSAGNGVAGGIIVQPGFTDLTNIASLSSLPQGNARFNVVLNPQAGTPFGFVAVAYTFVRNATPNTTRSAVSILPLSALDGSLVFNSKLIKGKQLNINAFVNTDLFAQRGSLINLIGNLANQPAFPNSNSSNFQLKAIAPVLINLDPNSGIAQTFTSGFALNTADGPFAVGSGQVAVNSSATSVNCGTVVTLAAVQAAAQAAAATQMK